AGAPGRAPGPGLPAAEARAHRPRAAGAQDRPPLTANLEERSGAFLEISRNVPFRSPKARRCGPGAQPRRGRGGEKAPSAVSVRALLGGGRRGPDAGFSVWGVLPGEQGSVWDGPRPLSCRRGRGNPAGLTGR
ncbi:unnamed protein product, partial [Heterosigma akashiwo]